MKNSDWFILDESIEPVKLRLFCLPYAGGGASIYRKWQSQMPKGVQVCRIQLPGRENRICDPVIDNTEALVDEIVDSIYPLLDCPFAIFGQSMGGLIAHRLAYSLEKRNKVAEHVYIAAVRPPHREHPTTIHHLPDDEFIQDLEDRQRTSKEVIENRELMELLMPMLRADFKIAETYRVDEPEWLSSNLSVLVGDGDEQLDKNLALEWKQLAGKGFEFSVFQGGHFFVQTHSDPVLKHVKEKLFSHIRVAETA